MQHIVRKQIIELRLDNSQQAFQVQNEVSNFYWKKILPKLETIFDELCGEINIFQIDRLEIDLGLIDAEQITSTQDLNNMCPGIISKIKREIQLQLNRQKPNDPSGIVCQWMHYMEKGYL